MHVLFLAPDTHVYNHGFLRGLKSAGCRLSAIGPAGHGALSAACRQLLDGYRTCTRFFDQDALLAVAAELGASHGIDRVETIDEPVVEAAAALRGQLSVPGLALATARLCRDKVAMKAHLRQHGVPCAESTAAHSEHDVRAFAERVGYPLVIKPIAGFGALDTHRVDDAGALPAALAAMHVHDGRAVAVEEFIAGHEGFFDTITDGGGVRTDFAAHYFPGCLEANQQRWISPQIAVSNRIDGDGYRDLRALGRKVIDVLGIRNSATHMEWFFGDQGLKVSEIAARPAGEKIWDLYRIADEFDVYRQWALAVLDRPQDQRPSRRFAAGSVQIRPSRDGRVVGHEGLAAAWQRCGAWIYECDVPQPGTPTKGLDKGWLCNTWFRLRHPDYDELRAMMKFLGETVKTTAQ
jgi:formate-dependent phosphoribosylglycinamide formyltransferase (GAR transformylase)